jgi:hypothetical protein
MIVTIAMSRQRRRKRSRAPAHPWRELERPASKPSDRESLRPLGCAELHIAIEAAIRNLGLEENVD